MRAFPRRKPVERGVVLIGIPPAILKILIGNKVKGAIDERRLESLSIENGENMKFFVWKGKRMMMSLL